MQLCSMYVGLHCLVEWVMPLSLNEAWLRPITKHTHAIELGWST